MSKRKPDPATPLRRGWTTGACATAATKAALTALLTGEFPDPVTITLPKGETPSFMLAREGRDGTAPFAAIIKDAGDDPDVTHGAEISVQVQRLAAGSGLIFKAGNGVGMVTKAGLPIPPGEPAINPVPRQMMRDVVAELCAEYGVAPDVEITVSVRDGEVLAAKTWNPRLGIVGGLSILGTTGIVHPFSCSAWIHSIHRGVDVGRAAGLQRLIGSTGSTSEDAAQALYDAPDIAMIDMGDFAGGLLKYVRNHPVPQLVIAGGFAKMVKLAQGALDLHSGRSQVDMAFLANELDKLGAAEPVLEQSRIANTAAEVLSLASGEGMSYALCSSVADQARHVASDVLTQRHMPAETRIDIVIVSREGQLLARTDQA